MSKNEVKVNFVDGARVEVSGLDTSCRYRVEFIDTRTDELVYCTTIVANQWSAANPRYYVPWRVKVWEDDEVVLDYTLDLKGQDVLVVYDSQSLGDSIAWMPFVEEFRKKHECKVTVMCFKRNILEAVYPELRFEDHNADRSKLPSFFATYHLGAYDGDYNKNRNHWRLGSLQQISSDMLGLPKHEVRPRIKHGDQPRPFERPYVCISEFATWQAKQWNYPGGWQEIANRLKAEGYTVVSVSLEPSNLRGIIKRNNNSIENTIRILQHAVAFIGGSTGLTVVSWALGVPVCLVSGSTMPWSEFAECTRVINTKVCHGCFNDVSHPIDRGNWKYCPRNGGYICTTEITPDMVWDGVKQMLAKRPKPVVKKERIMFLTPHCSTGGGPQYLLRCVQEMKTAGREIEVVEYANISDHYVVQKNLIKGLVPFHTLNGSKAASLRKRLAEFKPDIVHLHEFGERFLDGDSAAALYAKDRKWKVIETPHGTGIEPKDKRWWPDAFAFVSRYHQEMFKESGIPSTVVEYTLPKRMRPNRAVALGHLRLDPEQRHILNVGLFAPHKNQAEAFEVARQLPDIQFHFIGNTADNYKDYWRPLLENQPPNVVIWGERGDAEAFYAAMDAFLFPSTLELNPLVVKEALAWSLPVYMRNLSQYLGSYDKEPLVTFIDDDVDRTVGLLRQRFPEAITMAVGLQRAYELGA
jgi:autotransporter strand-loop-strand O-heptosyltransferase